NFPPPLETLINAHFINFWSFPPTPQSSAAMLRIKTKKSARPFCLSRFFCGFRFLMADCYCCDAMHRVFTFFSLLSSLYSIFPTSSCFLFLHLDSKYPTPTSLLITYLQLQIPNCIFELSSPARYGR